ncbi:S8 family serine peptidase [Nocardia sp. KC 131]|uniref:S8 family serine peptidase n=1 Tax=Nocardia arseniciresistens TaxID=3392119 RepID=UPI00398F75D8
MALTPIPDLGDLILVALHDVRQATPEQVINLIEAMPEFHPTEDDRQPDPARENLVRWQSRLYSARRYLGDEGLVLSSRRQWRITESGRDAAEEARRRLTDPDLPSVTQSPDQRNLIQHSVITRPLLDPDVRARVLDQPSDDSQTLSVVIESNFPVKPLIDVSARTVKADAARRTFDACGRGIRWAVVDSGIDRTHPHFDAAKTLLADDVFPLHRDFTKSVNPGPETVDSALQDGLGHGTHVAGIIAGHLPSSFPGENLQVVTEQYTEPDDPQPLRGVREVDPGVVSGMAPQAHLRSVRSPCYRVPSPTLPLPRRFRSTRVEAGR